MKEIMVQVEHLDHSFKKENQTKIFGTERQQILFDVSFQVEKGECMGILGESGSGKSTLGRVICGLLRPDRGKVFHNGKISVVFQDYTTSANPRFRVRDLIGESLRARKRQDKKAFDYNKEITDYLEMVGLDDSYRDRFPHELSGGQLQRVCIARAIAVKPQIILFDEAISSLDAHTQVQIMDLLIKIKEQQNLTYLFITHDLTSITYFCNRVLFLHQGKIAEICEVDQISQVKNSYAKKLLHSIIDLREEEEDEHTSGKFDRQSGRESKRHAGGGKSLAAAAGYSGGWS